MKLINVGFLIISNGLAGAEKATYSLVKELSKLPGLKIHLFLSNEIYPYYSDLEGVYAYNLGPVFDKNPLKKLFYLIKARRQYSRLLKRNPLDILNLVLEYSFLLHLYKRNSPKIISILHGEEIKKYLRKSDLVVYFLMKSTLSHSTKVISVSNQQIQELKFSSKVEVIPNGVDSTIFRPRRISRSSKVILFAGRYVDLKGIRELVYVARQLPQYEFWFAGQGPLQNIISGKNIKNLGFRSSKELVKFYNRATICVFPSHREGFPLIGLEAMACGRAIIVTPSGFSEYIENGKDGIIIPAKNESALKEAIVKLMTDYKLRTKLEKNARKKALKYGWMGVAKEHLTIYLNILNPKREKRS